MAIVYMQDNGIAAVCNLVSSVPDGVPHIETDQVLPDKLFREAWEISGRNLVENLDKAKLMAHDMRRAEREVAMAPYDDIIVKQVPGTDPVNAEVERAKIRETDAIMQADIDGATDVAALRLIQLMR